jgi:hypothetical protein
MPPPPPLLTAAYALCSLGQFKILQRLNSLLAAAC